MWAYLLAQWQVSLDVNMDQVLASSQPLDAILKPVKNTLYDDLYMQ